MGRTGKSSAAGKASGKKSAPKAKSSGPAMIKKEIEMFKSQKDWFKMDDKYESM